MIIYQVAEEIIHWNSLTHSEYKSALLNQITYGKAINNLRTNKNLKFKSILRELSSDDKAFESLNIEDKIAFCYLANHQAASSSSLHDGGGSSSSSTTTTNSNVNLELKLGQYNHYFVNTSWSALGKEKKTVFYLFIYLFIYFN